MSFAITVLGSSGMFQTLERACAGYLVDIDGRYIWIDAGAGTWLNLQRTIDFSELSGVLLTHGHPDHTTDVLQAYHARQYGLEDPLPRIPLWAPQETIDRLTAFSKEIGDSFDVRVIEPDDEIAVGEARFTFVEMAHPIQTLGVRLAFDGVTVAFSSDTGEDADFESLAGGVDVFVCEATSQESDALWEGHLRASQAGRIAARVGVKKLLLTHLRPGRDHSITLAEAKAAAPGLEVDLATDGARLELT